jgi:hypothetical protein
MSSIWDTLLSILLNFVVYGVLATVLVQIASELVGSDKGSKSYSRRLERNCS